MGDNDYYIDECVTAMNRYRALHQVEPLTFDPEIGRFSKKWADHLAATNGFEHNPNRVLGGKQLGENIAWSTNCYSGAETVDIWYNEVKDHNYRSADYAPKSGHFTQVVWKGSKQVGIWRSQRKDGTWVVVANFYPAGNYQGKFVENVLPPRDGKASHFANKDVDANHNKTTPADTSRRAEARGETGGGKVSTTTNTKTATGPDGTKTTTVTEITEGPGPVTKTRVTVTEEKRDGSKSTKTSEKTERHA